MAFQALPISQTSQGVSGTVVGMAMCTERAKDVPGGVKRRYCCLPGNVLGPALCLSWQSLTAHLLMYWLTHICTMNFCGLSTGRWDNGCLPCIVLSIAWDGFPPHVLPLAHLDHLPVLAEVVEVIRHVDFPEPCCAAEGSRAHPTERLRFP